VKANQADHSVTKMCAVLEISRSGYYAWCSRPQSDRVAQDLALRTRIREIHAQSDGTYGAPRIRAELKAQDVRIARKRVARLMVDEGIRGVSRRRFTVTTRRSADEAASDLVERNFHSDRPDQLWVADITYIPTWTGFLFLAVVLDVWSRRIVGWAMETHLRTDLVLKALDMALRQRQPTDVIHHSDRGCQYTSIAFGARCKAAGVRPSMGSVGDAYDNAMCESFFATLECEVIDRYSFKNIFQAKLRVFQFIEGWYNSRRRHSSLGYLSPVEFEHKFSPANSQDVSLPSGLPSAPPRESQLAHA
jgi:putative transposase